MPCFNQPAQLFLRHLVPIEPRREAGKRSGSSVTLVRWPDGHTFFAFLHRACRVREHNMTAQALGPK